MNMQLSGVLILALAVAGSFAGPLNYEDDVVRMKKLISAVIDYQQAQNSKSEQHISIPDYHGNETSFLRPLLSAKLDLTNGHMYGINAEFENVQTFPALSAKYDVRFPLMGLAGEYQLEGTVLNRAAAKGAGNYSLNFYNLTVSYTNIQLFETEQKALRVKSLGINFDLEKDQFVINGLSLKHMSVDAFERLFEMKVKAMFLFAQKLFALMSEASLVDALNKFIGDKTLEEVVEYLEQHKDDSNHTEKLYENMIALFLA